MSASRDGVEQGLRSLTSGFPLVSWIPARGDRNGIGSSVGVFTHNGTELLLHVPSFIGTYRNKNRIIYI